MLLQPNPVPLAGTGPLPQVVEAPSSSLPLPNATVEAVNGWSAGLPVHHPHPPPTFKAKAKASEPDGKTSGSLQNIHSSSSYGSMSATGSSMTTSSKRLAPLAAMGQTGGPPTPQAILRKQAEQQQQQQTMQQEYLQQFEPAATGAAPATAAGPTGPTLADLSLPYRSSHHAFIPKTRKRSAPVTRTWGRAKALSNTTALWQKSGFATLGYEEAVEGVEWDLHAQKLTGGAGAWNGSSSVGDLEALDTILDQLVVLDARMREALLKGPQVSFETVVSEHSGFGAGLLDGGDHDYTDHTFMTSVKGVIEEGDEEAHAEPHSTAGMQPTADTFDVLLKNAGVNSDASGGVEGYGSSYSRAHHQPATVNHTTTLDPQLPPEDADLDALRASIPVPILPKLARMYISSKQTAAVKAAPPPPPTAAWLLRSRLPMPSAAAPSYDNLVTQIKDVQRQYTCGTSREKSTIAAAEARTAGPPRSNLDAYISGLDGPLLPDVVAPQLGPSITERSRPSFVSMTRATHRSARHHRSRSASKERASPGGTRWPSPTRAQDGHGGPEAQGAGQQGNGYVSD